MIQPTVTQRSRYAARAVTRLPDVAFPLTFLAAAFGIVAGVGLAGVVIPAVMQVVVPVIVRVLAGV